MSGLLLYFYFFTEKTLRKEEKAFLGHESMEFATALKQYGPSDKIKLMFDHELADKPQYKMSFAVFDDTGEILMSGGSDFTVHIFPRVKELLRGRVSEEFLSLSVPEGREYTVAMMREEQFIMRW